MATNPKFEDVVGCQGSLFEWADSYDAKDWDRLRKCIAPSIMLDYRCIIDKYWEDIGPDEFIELVSGMHFLGDKRLKTQHFVGASRWEQEAEDKIVGHHQMRVAHQRYYDEACKKVEIKGHAHGAATVWYKKVNGVWKFAGLIPTVRWTEYDYERMFAPHGKHTYSTPWLGSSTVVRLLAATSVAALAALPAAWKYFSLPI